MRLPNLTKYLKFDKGKVNIEDYLSLTILNALDVMCHD